jgi:hypothetical protein
VFFAQAAPLWRRCFFLLAQATQLWLRSFSPALRSPRSAVPSSGCSFLAPLIVSAPLPTRKSGLRSSSAFRFTLVLASLYKLGFAFGLASNVLASSVETPSVAQSLQSSAIGFLLSTCWLLRSPETPARLLPSVATCLVGGPPPALLGSPQFPLAAALSRSRSFLLPSVAQTRTNSFACVPPTLTACCQYSLRSFRQHTDQPTTEVAPAPCFATALSVSPSLGELAAARRDKPRRVFRPSDSFPKSNALGDYLRPIFVNFLFFLFLFLIFLKYPLSLFHQVSHLVKNPPFFDHFS